MKPNHLVSVLAALVIGSFAALVSAQPSRLAIIKAEGEIGEELTRGAFARAVEAAKNARIDSLVFVLDSTGGRQRDARLAAQAIHEARHDLNIVIYVKRALGESVWLMAAGEQLLFSTSGASGAAIGYRTRPETGNPFDPNQAASIAAQISAIAEASGQPGEVYRAMINQDAELWTVETTPGTLVYSNSRPPDQTATQWDSSSSVLAITALQATQLGLGPSAGERPAEIATALGRPDYVVINDPNRHFIIASRAASQARNKLQRATGQVEQYTKEFADETQRSQSLERSTVGRRPYWSGILDKYNGRWRDEYNRFLAEVATYRRALLDVKGAIDQAADAEKRATKAMQDANRQAETLNELIGYAHHQPVVAHFDPSSKSAMETTWRKVSEELAWCDEQR